MKSLELEFCEGFNREAMEMGTEYSMAITRQRELSRCSVLLFALKGRSALGWEKGAP